MNEMQNLNQKMYDFVRGWAQGATLTASGVALADCIAYDVLSVLGRQLLEGQEKQGDVPIGEAPIGEQSGAPTSEAQP